MSVELVFPLPLHTFATSFLPDSSDNPMRFLIFIASFRGFAAPLLVLVSTDSFSLAFFTPVRQTVPAAAVLAELTLILLLFAVWATFHFNGPL